MANEAITLKTYKSPDGLRVAAYGSGGGFIFGALFKTYENGLYIAEVWGRYPKHRRLLKNLSLGIAKSLNKRYIYATAERKGAQKILEWMGGRPIGNLMYKMKV